MKTVVHIELTDEERRRMQLNLTGKGQPVTRAQVREFVEGAVKAAAQDPSQPEPDGLTRGPRRDLAQIDPEDAEVLAGESAGFIRGWNAFKHRNRRLK